mmetsp:Transcript_34945/g.108695  ORF Transcript_34945/g.108695 Transcript_34945/m.108695 type:complete len:183 (-) Transcript_34945:24-572(-)
MPELAEAAGHEARGAAASSSGGALVALEAATVGRGQRQRLLGPPEPAAAGDGISAGAVPLVRSRMPPADAAAAGSPLLAPVTGPGGTVVTTQGGWLRPTQLVTEAEQRSLCRKLGLDIESRGALTMLQLLAALTVPELEQHWRAVFEKMPTSYLVRAVVAHRVNQHRCKHAGPDGPQVLPLT